MKYRARCNRRDCQARRTIMGVYDPNDRESCHKARCTGMMREDVTRTRLGASEGRELCRCDGVQWADVRNSPHRRGTDGCVHYIDELLERTLGPKSKHSPF